MEAGETVREGAVRWVDGFVVRDSEGERQAETCGGAFTVYSLLYTYLRRVCVAVLCSMYCFVTFTLLSSMLLQLYKRYSLT